MGVLQSDEDYVTKNKYSNVNAAVEDREAARSEDMGTISQKEVQDLGGDANIIDSTPGVQTRGIKNDAMKAERDVDQAVDDATEFDESTGGQKTELKEGGKHTL